MLAAAKYQQSQNRRQTVSDFSSAMERRNLTGSPLYFKMLSKLNTDLDAAELAQNQAISLDVWKAVSANSQAYNLANFNAQQESARGNQEARGEALGGLMALVGAYYNSQQQKKMLTSMGA